MNLSLPSASAERPLPTGFSPCPPRTLRTPSLGFLPLPPAVPIPWSPVGSPPPRTIWAPSEEELIGKLLAEDAEDPTSSLPGRFALDPPLFPSLPLPLQSLSSLSRKKTPAPRTATPSSMDEPPTEEEKLNEKVMREFADMLSVLVAQCQYIESIIRLKSF